MIPNTDIITPGIAENLFGLFRHRVKRSPDGVAYRFYHEPSKDWQQNTWKETEAIVARWRQAFATEELEPGDRVAIMMPNCLEWVCFDLAALSLGLVVVPLYTNDRSDNIAYILEQTEAKIILCQGPVYREQLKKAFARLSVLRRIIVDDSFSEDSDNLKLSNLADWLSAGDAEPDEREIDLDSLATIVYTSGTTGRPKGVMLTHKNILANAYQGVQSISVFSDDLFLSFLPLSHMLERTVGYYIPIMAGATVAFSRSILKLSDDLVAVKPTMLISVPRIFERVHAKIEGKLENGSAFTRNLFRLTVRIGWQRFEYRQKRAGWTPSFLIWPLLDLLVARKVRAKLGGRLRVAISGGAPLSAQISKPFIGLGITIAQGYGLTETSPVISVNRLQGNQPASVGPPLPGVEIKVGRDDELLVRGDIVMAGYWRNNDATNQTIDNDRWLHTGDKTCIKDGLIYITGRIKEIIVLTNGEKVAPADMEMAIAGDPLFEQNMIIGEGRPHLIVLAVLNPELWHNFAADSGLPDDAGSLQTEAVQNAILARIDKKLSNFPGFAKVRHAVLSLEPWTIEQSLITPTLKLRRNIILQHMATEIESHYA